MKNEIYIRRFIETEDDLPKDGEYAFFRDKNLKHLLWCCYSEKLKDDYLYTYEYWLQPTTLAELIKEKLPTKDEINNYLDTNDFGYGVAYIAQRRGASIGIKWIINKLTE